MFMLDVIFIGGVFVGWKGRAYWDRYKESGWKFWKGKK